MTTRTMQRWPLMIQRQTGGEEASVTASTGRLDYYRDRVEQDGLNFTRWLPPAGTGAVLWSPDHRQLPVARGVRAVRQGDAHRLVFRWLDDGEATRVRKAFEAGVLGASIGFLPEQTRPNEFGGADIVKATVVEVSLTPMPANPDC